MTSTSHIAGSFEAAEAMTAADWVARLCGEPAEADWLAFETWLGAAPGNRDAYDKALGLWLALDSQAEALAAALEGEAAPPTARRPLRGRPLRTRPRGAALWWSGMAIAAAAVAITFALVNPRPAGQADIYATAKGERRDITLADGTHVALNTGSRLSVRLSRGAREITLAQGEAAFQVTHDPSRPFTVQVGDRVLRDIGTDFDVERAGGVIRVTVREGMVAVHRPGNDPRSLSLGPGSRLEHREGSSESMVLAADTDQAFSWRTGRLIYRNRPLSEVAADLSRYGQDRVAVKGRVADLKFSGVLTIDNQAAMIQRLSQLVPVGARRNDGVVTLSALNSEP